jgi:hypothetical protein
MEAFVDLSPPIDKIDGSAYSFVGRKLNAIMASELAPVFDRVRSILKKHADASSLTEDSAVRYCLAGAVGPATLRAWGGKKRSEMIPVAWTEIGKAYVSFHHMALSGSSKLRDGISPALRGACTGRPASIFDGWRMCLFRSLKS